MIRLKRCCSSCGVLNAFCSAVTSIPTGTRSGRPSDWPGSYPTSARHARSGIATKPRRSYQALPGAERVHVGTEPPFSPLQDHFDVIVTLECPSLDRTGLEDSLTGLPILNLDHHLGNVNYGVVNWVDAGSPALGEMVLRLSRSLGIPLGAQAATALLVALSSDTGGFRFANATVRGV